MNLLSSKYLSLLAAGAVVPSIFGQKPPLTVGLNGCIEGFVMDDFCIQRGTLLDDPTTVSLSQDGPSKHTIHCLIDVNSCNTSPYEVLLPPVDATSMFTRGFVLSDDAKAQATTLAMAIGVCSDCDGTGQQERGFRAAFDATIVDLGDGQTIPPRIDVTNVIDATAFDDPCGEIGKPNIVETYEVVGLGGINTLRSRQLAHGTLMMVGWGLFLPSGVLIAKFLKHRPNGLWFKIHKPLQITGLIVTLTGWIIALVSFTALSDKGTTGFYHGVMGCIVMSLGLCQPLNAFIRPHPPEAGEEKSTFRFLWEVVHKSFGWIAVLLAVATIGLGTTLLGTPEDRTIYQLTYGIGCGGCLLFLIIGICYDKATFKEPEKTPEAAEEELAK